MKQPAHPLALACNATQFQAYADIVRQMANTQPPAHPAELCAWFALRELHHRFNRRLDFLQPTMRIRLSPLQGAAVLAGYHRHDWSQLLPAYDVTLLELWAGRLQQGYGS